MSDDLTQLEEWITPLLNKLTRTERGKLARKIGTALRRSNQDRIKAQRNVDGTPYAPRKQQKTGRIKRRAMFYKLRQSKYLKIKTTPNSVAVGFFGSVASIARVHHYGLRDRVRPNGPDVQYEKRELLGFSKEDEAMITDIVLEFLEN